MSIDKNEKALLENYIYEMLDMISGNILPYTANDEDEKALNKGLQQSTGSLGKNLSDNIDYFVSKYAKKIDDFKNKTPDELGIKDDIKQIGEKFMVTFYPEIVRSFMLGYVQVYVESFKLGFEDYLAENKKFSHQDREDIDEKFWKKGFEYCKNNKYQIFGKIFNLQNKPDVKKAKWNNDLELKITEQAIKSWDNTSSKAGSAKMLAEYFTREMNPSKFVDNISHYYNNFSAAKATALSALQTSLFCSCFVFLSAYIKTGGILKGLGLGFLGMKARYILKIVIRSIQAKIVSSEFANYSEAVESLSLFEEGFESLDIDNCYLVKYENKKGEVMPTGKLSADV